MHLRRKREKGTGTPPSTFNNFRITERLFKDRNAPPRTELAFDFHQIQWDSTEVDGQLRGRWTSENGEEVQCYRVSLEGLGEVEMGQSRWKGKGKATDQDYAIIIPRIPGLVFFPSILPQPLQRSLVVESLQNARQPNVTSLDPHYKLPEEGLWNAWLEGKVDDSVESIQFRPSTPSLYDADRLLKTDVASPTTSLESSRANTPELETKKEIAVRNLVPKLRWSNVGYHYNWTTKLYEFDRPFVPIPPLMLRCCQALVKSMRWEHVFNDMADDENRNRTTKRDWEKWNTNYEPDAGIVNFYQAKDTLTGHTDHSEVDAVQPLVSLSLGLSSIFLVGGLTKDIAPLAILLRSGDGLIMSGREGRRAYHGLPRVLAETLPLYLQATCGGLGEEGLERDATNSWRPYGEYLERGARININLRAGTRGFAETGHR
ncbi:hypothetical protein JCM5353_001226 [Sporobolomyces roseus]